MNKIHLPSAGVCNHWTWARLKTWTGSSISGLSHKWQRQTHEGHWMAYCMRVSRNLTRKQKRNSIPGTQRVGAGVLGGSLFSWRLVFIYLEGRTARRKDPFCLLVHSPKRCNSQGWARLMREAQSSESPTWVSRNYTVEPSFAAFKDALAESMIADPGQ